MELLDIILFIFCVVWSVGFILACLVAFSSRGNK
nr:MAG TPA: Dynein heavy chain AAA lid domain [Caudoviricetes sp.]